MTISCPSSNTLSKSAYARTNPILFSPHVPILSTLLFAFYNQAGSTGYSVSAGLLALKTINGFPLQVEILSTSDRPNPDHSPSTALFLVTPGIKSDIFNNWVGSIQTTVFLPFPAMLSVVQSQISMLLIESCLISTLPRQEKPEWITNRFF